MPTSLQLHPKAQETTGEGPMGGLDRPGWARVPGIPAIFTGSRIGQKLAPASSPRIQLTVRLGCTEARFVPALTHHWRLVRVLSFLGG